jgi:hypothetical protein
MASSRSAAYASSSASAPNPQSTSCRGSACRSGGRGGSPLSGKGWWRLSGSPPANEAMTLQWFSSIGLVGHSAYHAAVTCWKPPSALSTLGGVRGGNREESPYSIAGATAPRRCNAVQ